MKQMMSLTELAAELERQKSVKVDYIADTRKLEMAKDAAAVLINKARYPIRPLAEKQLAGKLEIPVPFYDRMKGKHPELLAGLVNGLFEREPQQHMLRTLDGDVRAVLSNGYRPIDNFDFADAVLPVLMKAGVQVESCAITEQKMYIKVLCPWLDRELPVPEGLVMGKGHTFFLRRIIGAVIFSNSETGAGALSIAPGIFERQCTNLAVFKDEGFGKIHVGKKTQVVDAVAEYLSDATRKLDDQALWSRVRDVTEATMDGKVMAKIEAKLLAARGDEIKKDPAEVIEIFGKENQLNESERGGLLRHLVGSGEMTRYGLQWAVTRLAGDVESYDRASELERLGGAVIELPRHDWERLAA